MGVLCALAQIVYQIYVATSVDQAAYADQCENSSVEWNLFLRQMGLVKCVLRCVRAFHASPYRLQDEHGIDNVRVLAPDLLAMVAIVVTFFMCVFLRTDTTSSSTTATAAHSAASAQVGFID